MQSNRKFIFVVISLVSVFLSAAFRMEAQTFNALEHTLQKWKNPERFPAPVRFVDRFYLSGAIGSESLLRDKSWGDGRSYGMKAALSAGSWFTPVSGIRFGLSATLLPTEKGTNGWLRVALAGVHADYLANLTAWGLGYDENRLFDLLAVVGVGYEASLKKETRRGAFDLHGGFQARFNVSSAVDLYVEPQIRLYSDGADHVDSWQGYDVSAALMVGANYKFLPVARRSGIDRYTSDFPKHFFLSFGLGAQLPLVSEISRDLWRRVGPSGTVSAGYWFTPLSGARLTAGAAVTRWQVSPASHYLSSLFLQADYLLNITAALRGYREPRLFNLLFVAGVNYAFNDRAGSIRRAPGVGAGFQAAFRVAPRVEVFAEPRLTLYTDRYAGGLFSRSSDVVADLRAGMNFRFAGGEERRTQSRERESFREQLYLEMAAGVNSLFLSEQVHGVSPMVNPAGRLSVGYRFSPWSDVRLSGEFTTVRPVRSTIDRFHYKAALLSADYLFSLTTLAAGYDPERTFELSLLGGFNVTARTSPDNGLQFFPGFDLGMQARFALTPAWGLFLEPQLRFYPGGFAAGNIRLIDTDVTVSLQAGARYSFRLIDGEERRALVRSRDPFRGRFYLEAAAGLNGLLIPEQVRGASPILNPSGRFSLGYRFTPWSDVRLSGEATTVRPVRGTADRFHYKSALLAADYLFSLTTLAAGYDPERTFELSLLGGINVTARTSPDDGLRFFPGFDLGLQARFALTSEWALFAEPQLRFYPDRFAAGNIRIFDVDAVAGLQLGARYSLRNRAVRNERALYAREKADKMFVSFAGGLVSCIDRTSVKTPFDHLGYEADVRIGRRWSPLSAWRVGLTGSRVDIPGTVRHATFAGVTADYLLELNTLFAGYRPDRFFRLNLFAGVTAGVAYRKEAFAFAPGIGGGLQGLFRLSPSLDLSLEPKLTLYTDDYTGCRSAYGSDLTGSLLLGLQYGISGSEGGRFGRRAQSDAGRRFVSLGVGSGLFARAVGRNDLSLGNKLSLQEEFSYGYWLTAFSGLRGTLSVNHYTAARNGARSLTVTRLGVDYLLNFFNLVSGYRTDRPFDLSGVAGVGMAFSTYDSPLWSASFGLQGRFNLPASRWSLYLEPRFRLYDDAVDGATFRPGFDASAELMIGATCRF